MSSPRAFRLAPPPPPRPRRRGLLDFAAALLCLWGAATHTPVGALLRHGVAKLRGTPTSARPLLAYYSGGVWDAADVQAPDAPRLPTPEVPPAPQLAALGQGPALARGTFTTWATLPAPQQVHLGKLAARYQLPAPSALDTAEGPKLLGAVLEKATAELGSEDAAVLAVFAGHETARFAAHRVRAERRAPTLEALAAWLPAGATPALVPASSALSLGTAWGLGWPLRSAARISSPFGWRDHPTLGRRHLHTGVDLAVVVGTEVRAVADGVVLRASEDAVNGKVVIVDHGRGVTTAYCHNAELRVEAGRLVKAGQVLSLSGNTGRSSGPHLHYQLELGKRPVDPMAFRGLDVVAWNAPALPPRRDRLGAL